MPTPQNNPSPGSNPGETRLDSALDDYLLAKSKANETGNYRRNAERVLNVFLDWAEQRDVETFDALDVADLEAYALALNRRTTSEDGIAATTARKYYDYVRAYIAGVPAASTLQRTRLRRTAPKKPFPTTTNVTNTTSNSGRPKNGRSSCATSKNVPTKLSTNAATTR